MVELSHIIDRYNSMRSERDAFLDEWKTCDFQFEADTYEDDRGNLHLNTPLEQNLNDMELGRTAGLPLFDVLPDGYKVDTQKLETAKYIIDYFLDKEQRYRENRRRKMDKLKYGSGIYFTGIRMDIDVVPVYGDIEHTDNYKAFRDHKDYKEETRVKRSFTPKNVPIRMFLFDDRAMRQSDFSRVEDCIMLEFMSKAALELRYGDNKYFNKEAIEEAAEIQIEEGEYGIETSESMVVLYHYFDKIKKDYAIMINKTSILFNGKMMYPDGDLPFVFTQHFPNNACMYGISMPRRVRAEKASLNNMKQYVLGGARLSSGKILAMGNSGEVVDGNLTVSAGNINIARFSNSIEQVKEISTSMDFSSPMAAIELIKDDIRMNSGQDLNAVFEPPADQLGTVEIIEENKQTRNKSTDELMDFAYDDAFTKMLNNIAHFAPTLLSTKKSIKTKKGKVISTATEYPTLQIPNVKIRKEGGVQYVEEDMGEYGYLDFTPETLEGGMCVRVVTGTTGNTKMQIIEKNKNNEFMKQYAELSKVWGVEKMEEVFPIDQVMEKRKLSYGFGDKRLVADTKKDRKRKENDKKIALIKQLVSNEPITQDEVMQPQGTGQPQGGKQQAEIGTNVIQGQVGPV